jgi:hypothetical protein
MIEKSGDKCKAAKPFILFSEVDYNFTQEWQEEKREVDESKSLRCKAARPLILFTEVGYNNLILPNSSKRRNRIQGDHLRCCLKSFGWLSGKGRLLTPSCTVHICSHGTVSSPVTYTHYNFSPLLS